MALDKAKLPETTSAEKGMYCKGNGIIFGTIFVKGLNAGEEWIKEAYPEASYRVSKEYLKFKGKLPEDWKDEFGCIIDDYRCASLMTYSVSKPFRLKAFEGRNGIPLIIGYMLADYLQLGGHFNFRNFSNYCLGRNIKFLPWVIRPDCLRLYVYPLTMEQVEASLSKMDSIEQVIADILPKLDEILKSTYALVRLDEVSSQSETISKVISEIHDELEPTLSPFKKKLGFLYQGMKGKQNTRSFYSEMLAKKEKE